MCRKWGQGGRLAAGLLPGVFVFTLSALAQVPPNPNYVPGPDAQPKPDNPRGRVEHFNYDQSRIFPGTTRAVSVYVPAQYDGTKPACLMIFQDGSGYANPERGARVPVVFDNLIAEHSMPVTIGIFVDPGVTPGLDSEQMARYHRSLEYDGLGDKYARFLIEDLIPEVEKRYNLKISSNPDDRGLLGSSSGGIASWVAAWERPDAFHRVATFVGSYTNLRGGDHLSDLIRIYEPKPIRVFLQDGYNDQTIYGGSWYQANQSMAASLEYAGYDVNFVVGTEGHSGHHGAAIMPYVLRWLWRDYPKPIVASKGRPNVREYITDFLDPESDWQVAAQGYGAAANLAVDKDGAVFFADTKAAKIYKLGADGKAVAFKDSPAGGGMMFGPDGRLYVGEPSRHRIVSFGPDGAVKVVATAVDPTDLAVTTKGAIYFTDGKKVNLIDSTGKR
ncbi:MAG: gluconolactonase, partial [Acidobacteriota bacterium]|nr:gluconolactonase [Acidobacteriota bacterium]